MIKTPFILQGKWADGWTILAIPESDGRILKYEELKRKVRMTLLRSTPQLSESQSFGLQSQVHEKFINSKRPSPEGVLPFVGGWVGFLSYDLGAEFVGVRQRARDNLQDLQCPEVYFAYCPQAYLIDSKGAVWFVDKGKISLVDKDKISHPQNLNLQNYLNVINLIPGDEQEKEFLIRQNPNRFSLASEKVHEKFMNSNLTYKKYCQKIQKIKKYLFDGDTYQVNFSQRFKTPFTGEPIELFQKVSKINPSPYQFYCENFHENFMNSGRANLGGENFGKVGGRESDFAVISNSPELLIRGRKLDKKIGSGILLETRPIKGTVPRGKNSKEEKINIKKLLDSKKDEAELAMIVDLERNDLGKICEAGSVCVKKHRAIEKYSHVIHTVSTIEGKLEKNRDVFDAIEAVFPGGSITGCPKKRTMEIIDKLEDFKRGVYCGSAGYISLNSNFEFNIMIRTMFYRRGGNAGDSRIFFHSGGGIVVDSDPKAEYKETLDKAQALTKSLF